MNSLFSAGFMRLSIIKVSTFSRGQGSSVWKKNLLILKIHKLHPGKEVCMLKAGGFGIV